MVIIRLLEFEVQAKGNLMYFIPIITLQSVYYNDTGLIKVNDKLSKNWW